MNYRLIFTLTLMCLGRITANADNGVVIHQIDGTIITYDFCEKPKVTYNSDTLLISVSGVIVEYPITSLKKLTFINSELTTKDKPLIISFSKGISEIYTMDGVLIRTIPSGTQVTTYGLPAGIYIIRNNHNTYKIHVLL